MIFDEELQRLLLIDHFINVKKFNKENPTKKKSTVKDDGQEPDVFTTE